MEQKNKKRIRRVFSNSSEVLHLWANKSQDEARCKNVYFTGPAAYSYGSHYMLGKIIQLKGREVYLINANGYSVTTGKHINDAWRAAESRLRLKVYPESDRDISAKDILPAVLKRQDELLHDYFSHFSSRRWTYFYPFQNKYDRADGGNYWMLQVKEFDSFCKALPGFEKYALNPDFESLGELWEGHVRLCVEKYEASKTPEALAEAARKAEKRREAALLKIQSDIEAWRSGGPTTEPIKALEPQIIRVLTRVSDGSQDVQTSRGATVSLDDACRLLAAIEAGKAKAGTKVGHYTFNRVDETEVSTKIRIGCHSIDLNEARQVLGPFMKGEK